MKNKQNLDVIVTFRINSEMLNSINKLSNELGIPPRRLIRQLLRKLLINIKNVKIEDSIVIITLENNILAIEKK